MSTASRVRTPMSRIGRLGHWLATANSRIALLGFVLAIGILVAFDLAPWQLVLGLNLLLGIWAVRSWRLHRENAETAESAAIVAAQTQSEGRFRDFAETSSDWFWET